MTGAPRDSTGTGCRPHPELSGRRAPRRQLWPCVGSPTVAYLAMADLPSVRGKMLLEGALRVDCSFAHRGKTVCCTDCTLANVALAFCRYIWPDSIYGLIFRSRRPLSFQVNVKWRHHHPRPEADKRWRYKPITTSYRFDKFLCVAV